MPVGRRRHYRVLDIHRRHFVEAFVAAGISPTTAHGPIEEIIEKTPKAVDRAIRKLSANFPAPLSHSISEGVRARVAQLARVREREMGAPFKRAK